MAFKRFALDEHTVVTIYKRKASRNLRLTIGPKGEIKVSIPTWAPYAAGLRFAKSRQEWIRSQQRPARQLVDGQAIGKAHHLQFRLAPDGAKVTSRVKASEVVVNHPAELSITSPAVQRSAEAASIRALRSQAERLLPQRLERLASMHGFTYSRVSIKLLKSRWGSCDQHGAIVLNLFLIQLPWDCIDYVLLHELTHTRILKHGPEFWRAMGNVLPNLKELRKEMKTYQPVLPGA